MTLMHYFRTGKLSNIRGRGSLGGATLRRRLRHRNWALAALACLAIRLVIATLHVPPAMAGVAPTGDFPSQVVLCTASGMWIVQLDENGQPVGPKRPAISQDCPVCSTLSGAPLALAPEVASLPIPFAAPIAATVHRTALVIGHRPFVVRGRDPPSKS